MHLVHVDQDDLPVTDPGEQLPELLDVGSTLLRLGLTQQLFELLPCQVGPTQDATDGAASGEQAERLEDPVLELLHRPAVARQAVLRGVGGFHGMDDLLDLPLGKRGKRPPVWRYAKAAGPWRLYRCT